MSPSQPLTSRLRIVGTEGTLEHRSTPGSESLILFPKAGDPAPVAFAATNPYEHQLGYFVDCIASDREPQAASVNVGRVALQIALAAAASQR